MSGIRQALEDYLRVRRSLGHKLDGAEYLLRQFLDWLEQAGAATITTDLALAWAALPGASDVYHAQRLSAVRGFASWLRATDPLAQVPPAGLLPARPARALPYLYSPEEITAIMEAAGRLRHPASRHAYRALVGLLASTGLRVSEAISLDRADVMARDGLLRVTRSKFGKSREVPLHPSAAAALEQYAQRRDELFPRPQAASFLLSSTGKRLVYRTVQWVFGRLLDLAGVHAGPAQPRPGIHSLRHSFAVATLAGWYRDGADVAALLPLLSTYMGHVDPKSTYYYYSDSRVIPIPASLAA
jgi:integrase/recombinase XerD